jgi:hypothetical protein
MPESLQQELFHYANYLINNYLAPIVEPVRPPEATPTRKRRSGILQGTFGLPLPEDFDEPLEEFKDYME